MKDYEIYCIWDNRKFETKEEAKKELKNISQKIEYFLRTRGYSDCSVLIGLSNTDCKTATLEYKTTGKRGRPAKIIRGRKIDYHLHIYAVRENGGVSTFSNDLRMYLSKCKKVNFTQQKHNDIASAKEYVLKQSIHIRMCGKRELWNIGIEKE